MAINSWPHFDEKSISMVSEILSSGNVNYLLGEQGRKFENEYAKWTGSKYAIALSNGTAALDVSYKALGLNNFDAEVITTPRTYVATASSIVLSGAKPVFADVDIDSGNIKASTIEPLISKKTKAISIVHFAGWPADMKEIVSLAKSKNLYIIEDCAQAHGAGIYSKNNFNSVGTFGDIASWSFCQDKIISTGGEGGMVTTNSEELWNYIWSYKDHGKNWEDVNVSKHSPGYRWLHKSFGTNLRLTELQSALGRIQLKQIEKWSEFRKNNAKILSKKLSKSSLVRVPSLPSNIKHAWYKYYCFLNLDALSNNWNRDRIIQEIIKKGFPAYHGGCSEIYLEKSFIKSGLNPGKRLKNAKILGETSLMFLVHPTITIEQMNNYADVILEVLNKACR